MRVRRLMKNETPKTKTKSGNPPQDFRGKLNEMMANTSQIQNSFAASNTLSNYSGLSTKT